MLGLSTYVQGPGTTYIDLGTTGSAARQESLTLPRVYACVMPSRARNCYHSPSEQMNVLYSQERVASLEVLFQDGIMRNHSIFFNAEG